jgi:hypothetical protein
MLPLALWLGLTTEPEAPLPAILPRNPIMAEEINWTGIVPAGPDWSDPTPRVRVVGRDPSAPGDGLNLRRDGDLQRHRSRMAGGFGALTSQLSIRDPETARDDPLRRGPSWSTDETLNVPLGDMIFLFGSVNAESISVEQQTHRWSGRTGVGLRFRPWLFDEVVQLKTGPSMRYEDPEVPSRSAAGEQSELFLELSTKLAIPVVGPVNLEYLGIAQPPATALERERYRQNIRVALPLSEASQLHFGARWWSDEQSSATPFVDRAQLFFGVQLKR